MNKSTLQDNEHVYDVRTLVEKFNEKEKKLGVTTLVPQANIIFNDDKLYDLHYLTSKYRNADFIILKSTMENYQ